MTQYDFASFLRLTAVLILLAPALIFMLRNRRRSLRHLGIWAVIAVVVVVVVLALT